MNREYFGIVDLIYLIKTYTKITLCGDDRNDRGKQKHKRQLQIIEHWRVSDYWFKPNCSQIHLQQPVENQSSYLRDEQLFEEKTSKTF